MFRLETLGSLRLSGPGAEALAGRRQELVLLAYLLRRAPRPVSRAQLATLLWGEREEARARHSLRQALLRLRRVLGPHLRVGPTEVVVDGRAVELDVCAFEADAAAGRLEEAAHRWQGAFLLGLDGTGGEECRTWVDAERAGLERRLAGVLDRLQASAGDAAQWELAVDWARRWTEQLPLDERGHARLITALRAVGCPEEALQHATFVSRLLGAPYESPAVELAALSDPEKGEGTANGKVPRLRAAGAPALFTPDLVGREAELAALEAAWRDAQAGRSAVVLLEGEEGIGKSRLTEEFLRRLRARGDNALVLRARATDGEGAQPLTVVRELLSPLVSAPGLGGASDAALGALARLVPGIAERFPRLPAAGGEIALGVAAAEALAAVAAEVPVIGLVDDAQAADRQTRDFLLELAGHPPAGVALLLTVAPAAPAAGRLVRALGQLSGVQRIKLRALRLPELDALLVSMLALPADERHRLAARLEAEAVGNPLYAVEIVSALVDTGQLTADASGIWRLAPDLPGRPLPLPPSLQELVRLRIQRLSESARRLLAAAASAGTPVDAAAAGRAAGLSAAEREGALQELLVHRFLREAPQVPGRFEFGHEASRRLALEQRRARRRPRLRHVLLAALVLLTAAVAAVRTLASRPSAGAARGVTPAVIAVGAVADPLHTDSVLAAVLPDMLLTNLARVPGVQVLSAARVHEVAAKLAGGGERALQSAARGAGAAQVLEGVFERRPDGQLRLVLRRIDVASGVVLQGYAAQGGDAFELVDDATAQIASSLGVPLARLHLADATTSSVEAFALYSEGLRRYGEGDFRTAHRVFQAALARDTAFAMAAQYVVQTESLLGLPTSIPRARLLRLADRASDRERLLIRASWVAAVDNPTLLAIAETLAVRYPAEPDGHLLLGEARGGRGDFPGALRSLRRVVAMDSLGGPVGGTRCGACDALAGIMNLQIVTDSLAAAERTAREWLGRQPGSGRAWSAYAGVLALEDRGREAIAAYQRALELRYSDQYDGLFPAIVRIHTGDFAAADGLLREMAREAVGETRVNALWYLAISLRTQGRLREALAVARRLASRDSGAAPADVGAGKLLAAQILAESGRPAAAAALFDSLAGEPTPGGEVPVIRDRRHAWVLTHRAAALAAAGDTASLGALADSIEAWGRHSGYYGRDVRLHHHVRGLLLVARGQLPAAVAEFRQAIYSPTAGYTRTNFELGRALLALGRPREAVATLQPALRGWLDASNLYVSRTELHALLGRAWEAAGARDSAGTHYRAAFQAWSHADPELAARRDSVRLALARLR